MLCVFILALRSNNKSIKIFLSLCLISLRSFVTLEMDGQDKQNSAECFLFDEAYHLWTLGLPSLNQWALGSMSPHLQPANAQDEKCFVCLYTFPQLQKNDEI